jgi:ureidoacrylate peracid hydrolase
VSLQGSRGRVDSGVALLAESGNRQYGVLVHEIAMASEVLEAVAARDSRRRILENLDPRRTAHIVVDLQHGFLAPGAAVEVEFAREIVGAVNDVSRALRAAGGVNVFLRMNLATDAYATWRSFSDHLGDPAEAERVRATFTPGSEGFELWGDLDVAPEDLIVDKTRFGAFVPGASDLHELLQERDIDTLIISGTLTNVCCESTARDAMQMDYRVLFLADATATLSDAVHNATLNNMAMIFATVVWTKELLEALV